jgi:hypothetical protein
MPKSALTRNIGSGLGQEATVERRASKRRRDQAKMREKKAKKVTTARLKEK